MTRRRSTRTLPLALAAIAAVAACGNDDPTSITLLTYDSFPSGDPDSAIRLALDEFTEETGIEVEIATAGDTGTMLSKAILTAGNPEGDVMWGVDNTFLSRAVEGGVFEPYRAEGWDDIPTEFTDLVPDASATPVDFGDVCVNYDVSFYDEGEEPRSFEDLANDQYRGQLVVQNPATSSPGLAFLLATIATYGEDGWEAYWGRLRANDVLIVDSWDQAYYEEFSHWEGDRPLVVSYGSSPTAEVLFAEQPPEDAPTGVVESTCFRQVEFAGVLRGTEQADEARQLVDFLVSERFQQEIALELFVFPVNPDVELLPEFDEYAVVPDAPLSVDPRLIDANRVDWTDRWTAVATR